MWAVDANDSFCRLPVPVGQSGSVQPHQSLIFFQSSTKSTTFDHSSIKATSMQCLSVTVSLLVLTTLIKHIISGAKNFLEYVVKGFVKSDAESSIFCVFI